MSFALPYVFITAGFATAFNIVYGHIGIDLYVVSGPNMTNLTGNMTNLAGNMSATANYTYGGIDVPELQVFWKTMIWLFQVCVCGGGGARRVCVWGRRQLLLPPA